MAGIRDVWIGRLRLVTYDDSFQEAIGDELVLSGGVAALGARKPKRYAFTLPVHGTNLDANPYIAGQRMRRQVRSMTENAQARAQGFYMYAFLDPEQNGWLVLGAGTIQYAQQGGTTLAEYTLVMDEIYRVASSRTYRPARRIDWYDRRLSTTPRDYLGSRYSTDFAALTGGVYALSSAFAWLPPGAVDVSGLARATVAAYPVFCREGAVLAVVGQSYGTVLNFEQPETKRHAGDVVVYDRQSQGDWTPPYTNLVINPSFETGVAGYQTGAANGISAGASLSRVTSQAYVGSAAAQVTTTNAVSQEGASTALATSLANGVLATAMVSLKGNAGGEQVTLYLWDSGSLTVATVNVTLTTSWQTVLLQFTPNTNNVGWVGVRTQAASATTFFMDGLMVTQSSPIGYFDGSLPGYAWTGVPHASTSQGPYGWVNPIRNPSAENGAANWSFSAALAISSVADDPLPPGNCFDIVASGATTTLFNPFSISPNGDWLTVAPGQTVYAEAWVKLITAIPAGQSLAVTVAYATAAGAATGSPTTIGTLTPASSVGTWIRIGSTVTVPAGSAALAAPQFAGTAFVGRYRIDNVLICDATALGLPPAYNPAGATNAYPNTRYFDGDSRFCGWQGSWQNSKSVQWLNPEDSPGWEEAYGPEHPLNQSDIPVLTNGICQVRAEPGGVSGGGSNYLTFAVDLAVGPGASLDTGVPVQGGGGWQEQGRFSVQATAGTGLGLPTFTSIASVALMEWTPERAVLKVTVSMLGHADIYLTLQRGWTAPRLEIYGPSGSTTANTYSFTWAPNNADAQVAASALTAGQPASTGLGSSDVGSVSPGQVALWEPWLAIASANNPRPTAVMIRELDSTSWTWIWTSDSALYGVARSRLILRMAIPSPAYASIQFGLAASGASLEAEAVRNGANGSTAIVSDPGAISNPSAAPTAAVVSGGAVPVGTYYYVYTAYNAGGLTLASPQSTLVTTTTGNQTVNLTLTAVSGATGYLVYRATASGGPYYLVGSTTTTSFSDTTSASNPASQPPAANSTGQTSSGGQFVTTTQTTSATATLSAASQPAPSLGTYAIYARIRGFAGDTLNFSWQGSSAASGIVGPSGALGTNQPVALGPQSMAWQWAYIGEAEYSTVGSAFSLTAWIATRAAQNPAASNIAIDAVVLVPTQRSDTNLVASFDGVRDQAAQALIDTRSFSEVVQR
jgi:hypothetical protein